MSLPSSTHMTSSVRPPQPLGVELWPPVVGTTSRGRPRFVITVGSTNAAELAELVRRIRNCKGSEACRRIQEDVQMLNHPEQLTGWVDSMLPVIYAALTQPYVPTIDITSDVTAFDFGAAPWVEYNFENGKQQSFTQAFDLFGVSRKAADEGLMSYLDAGRAAVYAEYAPFHEPRRPISTGVAPVYAVFAGPRATQVDGERLNASLSSIGWDVANPTSLRTVSLVKRYPVDRWKESLLEALSEQGITLESWTLSTRQLTMLQALPADEGYKGVTSVGPPGSVWKDGGFEWLGPYHVEGQSYRD